MQRRQAVVEIARLGPTQNFGDSLNEALLSEVLSGWSPRKDDVFFGIGSIVNLDMGRRFRDRRKVVVSSGVGYGYPPRLGPTWQVVALRGPLSANALGLERDKGVIDGAVLLCKRPNAIVTQAAKPGFMPHERSHHYFGRAWALACKDLGLVYVSPSSGRKAVLEKIATLPGLITEALHGAIAAECLGVPWRAVVANPVHQQFKWHDWCASIGTSYKPHPILPIPGPRGLQREGEDQAAYTARMKQEVPLMKRQLRRHASGYFEDPAPQRVSEKSNALLQRIAEFIDQERRRAD